VADARRAYTQLAGDEAAPLHDRARAMLALGDLLRDARHYSAARKQYEKTRDFFVAKHEAFRVAGGFLRTSPEPQMKILLAEGAEKIFQIGPCFRKNENGRLHSEEFTMLEWYEKGVDYAELIGFTRALLVYVAEKTIGSTSLPLYGGGVVELDSEWIVLTVEDAFAEFAESTLEAVLASNRFEEVLVGEVEPEKIEVGAEPSSRMVRESPG